jgi:hypothetical protein
MLRGAVPAGLRAATASWNQRVSVCTTHWCSELVWEAQRSQADSLSTQSLAKPGDTHTVRSPDSSPQGKNSDTQCQTRKRLPSWLDRITQTRGQEEIQLPWGDSKPVVCINTSSVFCCLLPPLFSSKHWNRIAWSSSKARKPMTRKLD